MYSNIGSTACQGSACAYQHSDSLMFIAAFGFIIVLLAMAIILSVYILRMYGKGAKAVVKAVAESKPEISNAAQAFQKSLFKENN
jgi:cbb3-type cytochrome oxidase subunit 3